MIVLMIKIIVITWLIGVHAFAFLAIWDSDLPHRIDRKLGLGVINPREITMLYEDMLGSHLQLDGSVTEGSVIFFGDSLTQGLNVSAVTNYAVNYGIGKDTSLGLLKRIPKYQSVNKASTIVIAIGVNDLMRRKRSPADVIKNYEKILEGLPSEKDIIIQAAFPVDGRASLAGINKEIIKLNVMLQALASEKGHKFVNLREQFVGNQGNLKDNLHIGDGIHLSNEGYKLWIQALNRLISSRSS